MQKLDELLKRRRFVGSQLVEARAVARNATGAGKDCILAVAGYMGGLKVSQDSFLQLVEVNITLLEEECKELDATIGAIETLIK